MKNKYLYYCFILLFSIATICYIFFYNNKENVNNIAIINEIILQKTLLETPCFEAYEINDSIIEKTINNKIVCLFPYDICDLCFEDIFKELSNLNDSIKSQMIMLVPTKFTRNYKIYDQKYHINIKNIIYTNKLQFLSNKIDNNILIFFFNQKRNILSPLLVNKTTNFLSEYLQRLYHKFIIKI